MSLNEEERERYRRQILIPEIGLEGQEALKKAVVLVAGAGGLGSPVLLYLAAAGVGRMIVCDRDTLERSNLNRQIIHPTENLERQKAESAEEGIRRINPQIRISRVTESINRENIGRIAGESDLMVDCLDNFETRFILNRYSVDSGTPMIFAGVSGYSGQITFLDPPRTPCLNCFIPKIPPPGGEIPILGAAAGIFGSLQALTAVKYLTGQSTGLENRLLVFDGDHMEWAEVPLSRNPGCPVCGSGRKEQSIYY